MPRPKTLYERVLCVNRHGCSLGLPDPQAYILTENLRLEIVDEQAPCGECSLRQLAATCSAAGSTAIMSSRHRPPTTAPVIKTVRAVNDSGVEIASITNNCPVHSSGALRPNGSGSLTVRVDRARQGNAENRRHASGLRRGLNDLPR